MLLKDDILYFIRTSSHADDGYKYFLNYKNTYTSYIEISAFEQNYDAMYPIISQCVSESQTRDETLKTYLTHDIVSEITAYIPFTLKFEYPRVNCLDKEDIVEDMLELNYTEIPNTFQCTCDNYLQFYKMIENNIRVEVTSYWYTYMWEYTPKHSRCVLCLEELIKEGPTDTLL